MNRVGAAKLTYNSDVDLWGLFILDGILIKFIG